MKYSTERFDSVTSLGNNFADFTSLIVFISLIYGTRASYKIKSAIKLFVSEGHEVMQRIESDSSSMGCHAAPQLVLGAF